MSRRDEALALLRAWVDNENLVRHMLAVEAAVRHYARLRGRNEDRSIFGGQNNSTRRVAGIQSNNTANRRPLAHPLDQNGEFANQRFGGPHTGVCLFAFCDGSIKPVKLSVDIVTLTALATS